MILARQSGDTVVRSTLHVSQLQGFSPFWLRRFFLLPKINIVSSGVYSYGIAFSDIHIPGPFWFISGCQFQ